MAREKKVTDIGAWEEMRMAGQHSNVGESVERLKASGAIRAVVTLPIIGVAVFLLLCYAVADYDPNVALDLVVKSDPSDALRAVVLTLYPAVAASVSILGTALAWEAAANNRVARTFALTVIALVALPVSLLGYGGGVMPGFPFWEQAIGAGLFYLVGASALVALKRPLPMIAFWIGILAALTILVNPNVWLPPEVITTSDMHTQVGYVLQTDDGDLVVLNDSPRYVHLVPLSDVKSRNYCDPTPPPYQESVGSHGSDALPVCAVK